MCRATTCPTCHKTTWTGCGMHIDSVKSSVPRGQWCNGEHSQSEIDRAKAARPGLLSRLFGR